jgi:hypothetical protein
VDREELSPSLLDGVGKEKPMLSSFVVVLAVEVDVEELSAFFVDVDVGSDVNSSEVDVKSPESADEVGELTNVEVAPPEPLPLPLPLPSQTSPMAQQ